jgi:CDP-diglyceride synthetase
MKERREGNMESKLALVSLLLGIFSFVHLLGIEKAILAIIIGTWALKESIRTPKSIKLSWIGIILGLLYLVVIAVFIIFYFPKLILILEKLK